MKANINGVHLEGSPQEIMEYMKLQEEKAKQEYLKQYSPDRSGYAPPNIWTQVTCGGGIYRSPEWMKDLIMMN